MGDKQPSIDALRGIAVLLVVIVHHGLVFRDLPALQMITGLGQSGVQLFFVASAYTLCLSASRRAEPASYFYIRRYFRIAPLYYCGIALYALIAFATGDRATSYTWLNVASNVVLLHSMISAANNTIVPGGWSIATEVLFYALFPLLVFAYKRWSIGWWLPWFAVAAAFILNALLQFMLVRVLHRSGIANHTFLYYSLPNQFPVFLIGMALYFGRVPKSLTMNLVLFFFFGILSFALLNWNGAIVAVIFPLSAGLSFVGLFSIVQQRYRSHGILARVGEVSYSIYIIHFIFAWWLTEYVALASLRLGVSSLLTYAVTLLGTVLLSYSVARFTKQQVEDRFNEVGRAIIKRQKGQTSPSAAMLISPKVLPTAPHPGSSGS